MIAVLIAVINLEYLIIKNNRKSWFSFITCGECVVSGSAETIFVILHHFYLVNIF